MLDRLKKRAEFLTVARRGQKWVTPGLILQALPCGEAGRVTPRVGFTVSRKVGGAVVRNRARRRLRAAAEEILTVAGRPDRDYVLIGRQGTVGRPYAALLGDLTDALRGVERRGAGRSGREKAPR